MTETYDRLHEVGRLLDGEGYGTEADVVYEAAETVKKLRKFSWHLMKDEKPEYGERDYLVMGHKGGLQLAKGYKKSRAWDGEYFYCTKGDRGRKFIESEDVMAWAEIPPLEVTE